VIKLKLFAQYENFPCQQEIGLTVDRYDAVKKDYPQHFCWLVNVIVATNTLSMQSFAFSGLRRPVAIAGKPTNGEHYRVLTLERKWIASYNGAEDVISYLPIGGYVFYAIVKPLSPNEVSAMGVAALLEWWGWWPEDRRDAGKPVSHDTRFDKQIWSLPTAHIGEKS
jgi:hypothetical protein